MPARTIYITNDNIEKFDALHNKSQFIANALNDPKAMIHGHDYSVPVEWIGSTTTRVRLRCSHCPSEIDRT